MTSLDNEWQVEKKFTEVKKDKTSAGETQRLSHGSFVLKRFFYLVFGMLWGPKTPGYTFLIGRHPIFSL
jgi:hypothetical protein